MSSPATRPWVARTTCCPGREATGGGSGFAQGPLAASPPGQQVVRATRAATLRAMTAPRRSPTAAAPILRARGADGSLTTLQPNPCQRIERRPRRRRVPEPGQREHQRRRPEPDLAPRPHKSHRGQRHGPGAEVDADPIDRVAGLGQTVGRRRHRIERRPLDRRELGVDILGKVDDVPDRRRDGRREDQPGPGGSKEGSELRPHGADGHRSGPLSSPSGRRRPCDSPSVPAVLYPFPRERARSRRRQAAWPSTSSSQKK